MKVRSIEDIEGSHRDVKFGQGNSLRFILERDNMGFSLHKTIIKAGTKGHWHYNNHLEACYCIQGEGKLTNLANGQEWIINPDTCYILDEHDDHTFEAFEEDVILISVFNPPCKGGEVHNEDGSY